MDSNTWVLFVITIIVIISIPGPLTLLMVNKSVKYGLRKASPVIFGGSLASSILITISALGLGAIITASEVIFNIIKYLGVAYLIYLGLKLWFYSKQDKGDKTKIQKTEKNNLFLQSFILGITNPKDIIFFIAFLPQFLTTTSSLATQLSIIIISWGVVDFLCKILYGLVARFISHRIENIAANSLLDKISAIVFIMVGVAAVTG